MKKITTILFIFSAFIANAQRTIFTSQNNIYRFTCWCNTINSKHKLCL